MVSFLVVVPFVLLYSPTDFVLNFKPIPFAILLIIGVVLIPIQTSSEEYLSRIFNASLLILQGINGFLF
jgi:hypothetical protein